MRKPKECYHYSGELDDFIVASQADSLLSACQVLLVHAADLSWKGSVPGLFLCRVQLEDGIETALELTKARSQLGIKTFLGAMLPMLGGFLPGIAMKVGEVADQDLNFEEDQQVILASMAASDFAKDMGSVKVAGIDLRDLYPVAIDGLTSWLATGAMELRERQIAALGMKESEYDFMVQSLNRIGRVCLPALRVAFAKGMSHPELSISGESGFAATTLELGASSIELLRLSRGLDKLKRGQDKALPVFISALINRLLPSDVPVAYSCARYESKDAPEYDVVIPELELGMEVKLYQGPGVVTPDRIATLAGELAGQLKGYLKVGFKRILFVTNLSEDYANEVLNVAVKKMQLPKDVEIRAIGGGAAGIKDMCAKIIEEVQDERASSLEKGWQKAFERGRAKRAKKAGDVQSAGGEVPKIKDVHGQQDEGAALLPAEQGGDSPDHGDE